LTEEEAKMLLKIDGVNCSAKPGQSVLEVALLNNIEIPHLCQSGLLNPYGACGLCIIEVEGVPKLLRSCATLASDNMVVTTMSDRITASRKLALELLLSNHRGDCLAPCQRACPGDTDCQAYVGLIANGEYDDALELLKKSYPLPAALGRICPHPCESECRRQLKEEPIAIASLKQFVADLDLASCKPHLPQVAKSSGKTVGIVGGGPAGLTAAWFLAQAGHQVTIYEAMPKAGGMLQYGIPEYRLPKAVLDQEIALVEKLGVKILTNTKLGKDFTLVELQKKHDAVLLAIGAWRSAALGCAGEDKQGVLGGIDMLIDIGLGQRPAIGKRVAVVGGGNTAMDACRSALRLGAKKVYLLYRRSEDEMPAEKAEISEAKEEGVEFRFLVAPSEVLGADKVTGIRLQKMELGEPDLSGRCCPLPVAGAFEDLPLDTIIAAIGQKVIGSDAAGVTLGKRNTINADQDLFTTSAPGVFAAGDAVNDGPGIAIAAIGQAQKAAKAINQYLAGAEMKLAKFYISVQNDLAPEDFAYRETAARQHLHYVDPKVRRQNFQPVYENFNEKEAQAEAARCLECGCLDVYECLLLKYARDYQVEPERVAGEMKKVLIDRDHPYIFRDNNKCSLCGLCTRVCGEHLGIYAIALTNRGFETEIKNGLGVKLSETDCIECGMCIHLCPSGALQERHPGVKPIPLTTVETAGHCSHCGLNCPTKVHRHNDTLVKITPADDLGMLCKSGRFEWFKKGEPAEGKVKLSPVFTDLQGDVLVYGELLTGYPLLKYALDQAKKHGATVRYATVGEKPRQADVVVYSADRPEAAKLGKKAIALNNPLT
jgi:formate dehydrogenase major subunit